MSGVRSSQQHRHRLGTLLETAEIERRQRAQLLGHPPAAVPRRGLVHLQPSTVGETVQVVGADARDAAGRPYHRAGPVAQDRRSEAEAGAR